MDPQPGNKIKFIFVGVLALLIVLVGLLVYFRLNHAKFAPGHRAELSLSWKTFEGTNPPFDFVFEYPASWKAKEIILAGASPMAQVSGPQDKVTKFIPALYIKVKEFKGDDLSSKFSETLLKREGRFRGFKKLHEGSVAVDGVSGLRLAYQYVLPLPMQSTQAKDTVVRREEVLLGKDGKSYQISFWSTGDKFEAHQIAFERALKTFRFTK